MTVSTHTQQNQNLQTVEHINIYHYGNYGPDHYQRVNESMNQRIITITYIVVTGLVIIAVQVVSIYI